MRTLRGNQGGVVLIEAMIGILIFSLGVLALVAMQAVSTSNVSNARYRSEAAFLANEITAAAWMGGDVSTFKWPGGNATTIAWAGKVATLLPQANLYPPTIVTVADPAGGYRMTVTVRWKAPDAISPSNHVAVTIVAPPG